MSEIKERASRVASDDFAAMKEVAETVRWAADALPDQIAAADALKRSLHAIEQKPSEMKFEVVKIRYAKLLLTL